jgi:hypothetical protein
MRLKAECVELVGEPTNSCDPEPHAGLAAPGRISGESLPEPRGKRDQDRVRFEVRTRTARRSNEIAAGLCLLELVAQFASAYKLRVAAALAQRAERC